MDHTVIKEKLRMVAKDPLYLSLCGIAILVLVVFVFYVFAVPEWQGYQKEFRDLVTGKFGPDRAESVPSGIQQIYVKELGATDRCVTCHLGVMWKGFEDAPEPYRSHPRAILDKHPVDRFGCTVCHGGEGYATLADDAHGPVPDWEEPVLGTQLGEFYVLSDRSALLQMNCNRCHRYEKETPGASAINRGKELVQVKGCRACHVINGRGGTVGPELTYEGSKAPEQFNYERIQGFHSAFSWHVAHFKDPKGLVPETVMPNFGFTSADAQALAMLVMSWKRDSPPLGYVPNNGFRDVPSPEEKAKEDRMLTGPGAFFVSKGCFVCHSVSTLGIDAAAAIGPDLALAVTDVPSRFGRTLDDFLARPTGTMEVVLSTMITLSPDERAEAISKLKQAYQLKQEGMQGVRNP